MRVCELFRLPLLLNSAAIIVAHNHPSGGIQASPVIWRKFCQEEEGGEEKLTVPYNAVFDLVALPQPPEANPTGYQVTPALYALVPRLPPPPEANPAAVDQSA